MRTTTEELVIGGSRERLAQVCVRAAIKAHKSKRRAPLVLLLSRRAASQLRRRADIVAAVTHLDRAVALTAIINMKYLSGCGLAHRIGAEVRR
jgi:hypothetical protein